MQKQLEERPLPPGVREKHGSWHYVYKHQWTKLCRISEGRAQLYIKLADVVQDAEGLVWHGIAMYLKNGMGELSEETKASYRTYGVRMLHHFGHYWFEEVEPTHCAQFLEWSKDNDRAIGANREKSFMSSVWEYAMRKGWAKYNPWRGVRRNKERRNTDYVEHDTLVTELDRAPSELQPLYAVAYLLGIRQTDLRLAKKTQIVGDKLKVVESKTGKENEHEITKTVRYFLNLAFAHASAVAAKYESSAEKLRSSSHHVKAGKRQRMATAVRVSEFIFLSKTGKPWSKWGLQSALRRFKPGFKFRQLRPKAQTDVPNKDILGHTGQMRERYTRKRQLSAVK